MRLWIGLALIAICSGTNLAQSDEYEWYGSDDSNFESDEYVYQLPTENKDDNTDLVKEQPEDGNRNYGKTNEELENFSKNLKNVEDNPSESVFNDYQFEDNRSELKDELNNAPPDMVDVPAANENLGDKSLGYKRDYYGDDLTEINNADYNNPSDTNQFNDENVYDMDENTIVKTTDGENQNILTKDIPEAEKEIENKPLHSVNDLVDKVFDDAENEKLIQENIESIEQTNQLVKDLTSDITSYEKETEEGRQSAKIKEKPVPVNDVEQISSSENFDEFQKSINQDSDGYMLDKDIVESQKNYEDLPLNEIELDNKETSQEQNHFVSQQGDQNEDLNSEDQIVEENVDKETENNDVQNEELSNDFEEYADQVPNDKNMGVEEFHDENSNKEDTFDKAYDDLNDDLKKLFETWDKLQEDDTTKEDVDGEILDYEDKYNKPYRESNVLSVREYDDDTQGEDSEDDIEDINEQTLETIDVAGMDIKNKNDNDIVLNSTSIVEKTSDTEDFVDDDEAFYRNDPATVQKNNKLNPQDQADQEIINNDDEVESLTTSTIPITQKNADTKVADNKITETSNEYAKDESTMKSIAVDDLNPDQYEDLMKQFAIVHSEDLEIKSGDNVAPIHMSLSVDESVVIESPDYPNNYPTNNVIDYYLDGSGTGIELNITDFSVNGILGDYLLIKPGGIDASGNDGLVFSYHLNSKRQYRFLNVDRLFVRFFAHPGDAMFKGYQFSVKMIYPPDIDEELQPEPEPLLPPLATHTVTLGGTSLPEFADIEEDFRALIADMATMYINANDIDSGLNSTLETAQITQSSLCNVNWPDFESCVAVTFGVPLLYGDDRPARLDEADLRAMWEHYVSRDPFAARLARLGITEFNAPNDRRVLTVWLVIAAGVVISIAMLAFALWRFSCFEDYTRMAAYSDTDSVNEKRVLDMYPTPHQSFPALYSEQQLQWDDEKFDDTTRVDMGGYANRSYVRDDAMDMDSDEDIVSTPRDRNSFSPGDIYQV